MADEEIVTPHTDMATIFRPTAALRCASKTLTLDKALFDRVVSTAAAVPRENQLLAKYTKVLDKTNEVFRHDKTRPVVPHPDEGRAGKGERVLILDPKVKPEIKETWSKALREASEMGDVSLIPYEVPLDYSHWNYLDVMKCVLPEDLHGEIPTGFNTVGHIAHLNLRDAYLPYKTLIAKVILDKNAHLTTVINKTDNVGTSNEFRTFTYECLAGPDDLNVEIKHANCVFEFDYSKVYFNPKLNTEHERVVGLFKEGEVVVDVMAGIGPFAVPAGKRGVFVWANDKNPESFGYMERAVRKNKVGEFVKPFNHDGHTFIREATDMVLEASKRGDFANIYPPGKPARNKPRPEPRKVFVPSTVAHFVMNLPASAIEFLHNFRGVYQGQEELFSSAESDGEGKRQLPMVHVHCFAPKPNSPESVHSVLERIEKEIGVLLKEGDGEVQGQASFHEVRDVAPAKLMFCVSFRLPSSVAFAERD